jgi:RHS repeat-associated protein
MISENFEYDNLNRLDRVYRGGNTLLDMTYESNKGGIVLKSDIGTLNYGLSGSPYALSSINPSTGLTPNVLDSITYTSFESVNTISEGAYKALFTYNSDNERAKMVVQQNNSDILTRWYPNSRYIKETAGGVTKEYTFIGGDAYSAPVVAIKQNGTTTYYNLLRDHLGSITRVVNASNNSLVAEYSYDAWGRMRDKTTWVDFAPGSEPSLFIAGRGFTGHEHLPWFNLINMNGRFYDPLTGQFLSADNYVQAPGFTQSFNRYGYCLNNPLIYTDPSGNTWASHFFNWNKERWEKIVTKTFEFSQDITVFSTGPTAGFLMGFFDKAFNNRGEGTWLGAGFRNGFNITSNGFKINSGFSDAVLTESQSTIMGSIGGTLLSQYYNYTNRVVDVNGFYGATIVRLRTDNVEYAMTMGNFIMGHTVGIGIEYDPNGNLTLESSVLIHEYGHYLQSFEFGPIHYIKASLNSIKYNEEFDVDTWTNTPHAWSERDASLRGL